MNVKIFNHKNKLWLNNEQRREEMKTHKKDRSGRLLRCFCTRTNIGCECVFVRFLLASLRLFVFTVFFSLWAVVLFLRSVVEFVGLQEAIILRRLNGLNVYKNKNRKKARIKRDNKARPFYWFQLCETVRNCFVRCSICACVLCFVFSSFHVSTFVFGLWWCRYDNHTVIGASFCIT